MSLPYFYERQIETPVHRLSAETSRHCVQVLRIKTGEQLQLTDGKGNLFTGTVMTDDKEGAQVRIQENVKHNPAATKISIAISLLKNPSRFEWFLEKVTEIGVNEIIPVICERTSKQNMRFERMNNILISAMLQSQQVWLPALHRPVKFWELTDQS